ncbi:xanthan lyase [Phocaeicola coprophilus]|uniref:golvesin C-terminal-like domain-containing protein n=1 Tax=Phocaeicola coprophilus TaxID=387090 RepID=UPI0026E04402|nr:xanthan lyase [Phocaeicola coprophilus]
MRRIVFIMLTVLFCPLLPVLAQSLDNTVKQRLTDFFKNYQTSHADIGTCKLDHFVLDHEKRTLQVYASPSFGYQPFTEETTSAIYRLITQSLPGPVNYYQITIYADGMPIDNLIPNAFRKKKDTDRQYKNISYHGNPWVENLSRPYEITRGLKGTHLAVWQSHGMFYKIDRNEWRWQRPRLFGTTEDLFTQSFVVPYLIPMLENAGAIVFTPRERNWQRQEVIVDNNTCPAGSQYLEVNYKKCCWTNAPAPGFAQRYSVYPDNHNPFADGTARMITTQTKPEKAFAEWIPDIPEKGKYAVYVSYQTLPESVSDAKYLVFHNGGVTEFRVNQQMGGGTWVYLGTFEFDKGCNDYGMVVLSNESKEQGVVSADAVRFGGGMGNIERGGSVSGMPRYLEGARYWAQWAGMPYPVYSKSNGTNDYNDDINTRSLMTNYLSGGSVFNPAEKGLKVPFEMTLGFHSDAGFKTDDQLVGTLGIYTTGFNEGRLNCGISRYASRDLADMVLTGLKRDIDARFGVNWQRRSMWNRNYSETRLPAVPSMILELLSHQNFNDLKLGHEPAFKFTVARSVYKSVLKYLADMHGTNYTVQPLPVTHFAISEGKKKNTFDLRWTPTEDVLEPTAEAQGYIVYTRVGRGGFDNGTYTRKPELTVEVEPGLVYSFRVTAVNRGGESFPSETLSACKAKRSKGAVLIVNAFDRVSGPGSINSPLMQGFDLLNDPGIPDGQTPAYCGYQQNFDRSRPGIEDETGLGYSGNELEGKLIAGNTFDYPFIHGKAIQAAGRYSFVSCSDETIESGSTDLTAYDVVDFLYGADRKGISPEIREALTRYCNQGGSLLISGAYLSDGKSKNAEGKTFCQNVLKYADQGLTAPLSCEEVSGLNVRFRLPRRANETTYAVPQSGYLYPTGGSFSTFVYTSGNYGAGIAYRGNYRTFVLGFPFESIPEEGERNHVMKAILGFFEK